MDHILVRRMAIVLAAVSFGALMVTMLFYSVGVGFAVTQEPALQPVMLEQQTQTQSLPAQIRGTALIARNLAVYDGAFYEDGTGREVLGVAALVVQNSSGQMLWQCGIEIKTQSQVYVFEGMLLPPYATVLIPEKNARQYKKEALCSCEGYAVAAPQPPTLPICLSAVGMGGVSVENISQDKVRGAVMYHKTYLTDAGMFIGGKAFKTELPELAPGQQITVKPENYVAGYSQILCIYS